MEEQQKKIALDV